VLKPRNFNLVPLIDGSCFQAQSAIKSGLAQLLHKAPKINLSLPWMEILPHLQMTGIIFQMHMAYQLCPPEL
jgi:hypothetical protein